jgi:hypothetical protein
MPTGHVRVEGQGYEAVWPVAVWSVAAWARSTTAAVAVRAMRAAAAAVGTIHRVRDDTAA